VLITDYTGSGTRRCRQISGKSLASRVFAAVKTLHKRQRRPAGRRL